MRNEAKKSGNKAKPDPQIGLPPSASLRLKTFALIAYNVSVRAPGKPIERRVRPCGEFWP